MVYAFSIAYPEPFPDCLRPLIFSNFPRLELGPQGPSAPPGPDAAALFPPQCPCEAPPGEPGPKGPPGADGPAGPPVGKIRRKYEKFLKFSQKIQKF